jgi:hypothetical protein
MLQNLNVIIPEIQSLADAKIVVYNIYNPFAFNLEELLLPVNSEIQAIVEHSGGDIALADAYGAFKGYQSIYLIQGDNHPTVPGHEVLAEIGLKALGLE